LHEYLRRVLPQKEAKQQSSEILAGSHPDTMIHLTNDAAEAFSGAVDDGTFFGGSECSPSR